MANEVRANASGHTDSQSMEDKVVFRNSARQTTVGQSLAPHAVYGGKSDTTADSNACIACPVTENILHLAECPIIKQEFWNKTLETLERLGMPQPQHESAFLVLGRIDADTVIDKYLAGVMFLACRCLYAEITRARIEKGTPDLQVALREAAENRIHDHHAPNGIRSLLEKMVQTTNVDEQRKFNGTIAPRTEGIQNGPLR